MQIILDRFISLRSDYTIVCLLESTRTGDAILADQAQGHREIASENLQGEPKILRTEGTKSNRLAYLNQHDGTELRRLLQDVL